jgi:hypothetical protein
MGKSILSPDMVSIGLLIAHGNIDITLEELFAGVMEYQTHNNRIFGVSDEDYRAACFFLAAFESNLLSQSMDIDEINRLKFRQIIPDMLRFNEVYMNDEGEHWIEEAEHEDWFIERFYGLDRKGYDAKTELKNAMADFFRNCRVESIEQEWVAAFMTEQGLTEHILEECSTGYIF